jgi:orotate phosphoribosyltransferase
MGTMNRIELASAIFQASHLKGEFLLRSGVVANEYFDKYQFESKPALIAEIAKALAGLVPSETEVLAGLELGGVPLATVLSQTTGLPTLFVRKQAKAYGTCRLAEGGELAGRRLCVIEDVVTSGGQIVESVAELRSLGAQVDSALCVIDRESGGRAKLAEIGIELRPLYTMSELQQASI